MTVPPRIAFSTLAFPDATLAAAASAGLPVVAVDSLDLGRGGKRWHPEIEEPEVALPQHLDLLARWLESER
jgi:hypothetical protein